MILYKISKSIQLFLRKLRICTPQDPDIGMLHIYSRDTPTSHEDTWSIILIVVTFIIARNWKSLRYFSTKE